MMPLTMKRGPDRTNPLPRRGSWVLPLLAGLLLVPALSFLGGATAATPELSATWKNPAAQHDPYTNILIVGITRNAPARRQFEDLFVSVLRGRSLAGRTSYTLAPDLDNVKDPQAIVATLFAEHVDGVITVRLVSMDDRKEEDWDAAWRKDIESGLAIRPYVQESLKQLAPDSHWHGAELALWDVQTSRRLWAARSAPLKVKSLRKHATILVQQAMDQLRYEDLL
jgi:hypothetical protein